MSIAWPENKRNPDVSFTIHDILSAHPSRFRKIDKPPVDPVSGERRWTVNDALRAAGRTPQHPVTSQERVDRVRDLVRDDEDAALAVKDILRRPCVDARCLPARPRHILRQADRPRYFAVADHAEEMEPAPVYGEPEPVPALPRRMTQVHYSEAPREVLELLGACITFYTQTQRLIPALHLAEYDNTKHTLFESIERVSTAAGWAETVINTGDASIDEALARLLGGE